MRKLVVVLSFASLTAAGTSAWLWNKLLAERARNVERTARLAQAASPVLSPTQLEQLDAMLKRELDRHETELRMNKLQRKVAAQADTPPD